MHIELYIFFSFPLKAHENRQTFRDMGVFKKVVVKCVTNVGLLQMTDDRKMFAKMNFAHPKGT